MHTPSVWIFGDSILRGVVWSAERGRYVTTDRLGEERLARDYGLVTVNRSRFGYTVDKGLAMIQKQLSTAPAPDLAILEYGGNDADFVWAEVSGSPEEEHLSHTPLPRFVETYTEAVRTLKAAGARPVLCTLPPVCASRYLDWISRGLSRERILSWLGDEGAIYRYQERYSHAVEEVARREDCALVDLRGAFLAERKMERLYCADGIHPSEAGQELIGRTFAKRLETSSLLAKTRTGSQRQIPAFSPKPVPFPLRLATPMAMAR